MFDSDEFLLSKKNFSLQHELSKLNEDVIGARYLISNYISTFDFDKNNINHYKRLIYKSSPSIKYDPLHAKELIRAGELTFFDVPFPSKMVFRTKKNLLIDRGSHTPRYKFKKQIVVNIDLAECAHLSLISKDTLTRKSSMGKNLIESGDSKSRGWQNQLIYELDVEGKLDWFWEKHSIQVNKLKPDNPKHVADDLLVTSLIDSIALLKEKFGGDSLSMLFGVPLRTGYAKETNFTFASVFQMCEFFDRKLNFVLRSFLRSNKKI